MSDLNLNYDLLAETLVPLRTIAERLGKTQRQLLAWATVGLRGHKLEVLRLECLHTSEEAFERFLEKLNGPAQEPAPPPARRLTPSQRRGDAAARRQLEQAGFVVPREGES